MVLATASLLGYQPTIRWEVGCCGMGAHPQHKRGQFAPSACLLCLVVSLLERNPVLHHREKAQLVALDIPLLYHAVRPRE